MNPSTPNLPKAVEIYLDAVRSKADPSGLSDCFAENAIVYDEDREYVGLPGIKSWKQQTDARYRYKLELLDAKAVGDLIYLLVRVTGSFPGSPVELHYRFKLENNKISELRIQPKPFDEASV